MTTDVEKILDLLIAFEEIEEDALKEIINAKYDFNRRLEEEKRKLPYNINLLDEIHANENAHSRILVKLLQYNFDKKYVFLRMFLDFLGRPFSELQLNKPKITAESNRIDARIRDDDFSIIIENKIQGARDQDEQIVRYIDNEKDSNYNENDIYILYLTKVGGSPGEISITRVRRREFKERYREINYRDCILPWIAKTILPWINQMNQNELSNTLILQSAVLQYKNHLEGLFYQREGETIMKNSMIKIIEEKLQWNLPTSDVEKLKNIKDFIKYSEELLEFLIITEKEFIISTLSNLAKEILKLDIDGIDKIQPIGVFGKENSEIQFKPRNWNERYSISLCFQNELSNLFYAIKDSKNESIFDAYSTKTNYLIDEFITKIGPNDDPNDVWLYSIWIIQGEDYQELIKQIDNASLINFIERKIKEIIRKTKDVNLS